MAGFWVSPTGKEITGTPEASFISGFTIIPEGTTATAVITSFSVIEKEATPFADASKFIQVSYKLLDGDFKGREVIQKIKAFEGKPEQIERSLNMLMLIMKLCSYKPQHNNEPTTEELSTMCRNVVGIKIGEWSMPKADGSGMLEGNFVREIHPTDGFKCETGIKAEVVHTRQNLETAFSRNAQKPPVMEDDIPF